MSRKQKVLTILKNNYTFILFHAFLFVPFFTEFAWKYVYWALASYYLRMFFLTGFVHRYFSHRTYKTSRAFQFIMAFLSQTAGQAGVLWWAANHRHHHRYSDEKEDLHSPRQEGFWHAHMGWLLEKKHNITKWKYIRDLAQFPELRWLNRNFLIPFVLYAVAWFWFAGWPGLIWGFGVSTVLLYHGTWCVNSLTHIIGKKRFPTTDDSKNSWLIAIITLGEGWHNNHHYYQKSTRNGFYWWEIDITFYILQFLNSIGLIWQLNPVPASIYQQAKKY